MHVDILQRKSEVTFPVLVFFFLMFVRLLLVAGFITLRTGVQACPLRS